MNIPCPQMGREWLVLCPDWKQLILGVFSSLCRTIKLLLWRSVWFSATHVDWKFSPVQRRGAYNFGALCEVFP